MPNNKRYTIDEIFSIVDNEGLGYAVQHYTSHDNVPKEIAKDWKLAQEALDRIDSVLHAGLRRVIMAKSGRWVVLVDGGRYPFFLTDDDGETAVYRSKAEAEEVASFTTVCIARNYKVVELP